MRTQGNRFKRKEQDKTSEKDLNDMEISNLPDKKFKVIVINILTELEKKMDDQAKISTKRWKM